MDLIRPAFTLTTMLGLMGCGPSQLLQSGARATVVWPFENESLNRESTQLVFHPADGGLWHFLRSKDLEFSGSEVSFTVPTTLALGSVSLSVESHKLPLSSCEGPSSCLLDTAVGSLGATVVP